MKLWAVAIAMWAAASSLVSCDNNDEDCNSMLWKAEVPVVISGDNYMVSDLGDTLVFACKNYSKPQISIVMSGEISEYPVRKFREIEISDSHKVEADWFTAELVDNKLTLAFKPNKDSWEQMLYLTVTEGSIFETFKFTQYSRQDRRGL